MPSVRASALRLSRLVASSGSSVEIPCVACLQHDRTCISSSLSRRCSECHRLNQGCSLSASSSASRLAQEVAIRSVLDFHLRCAARCLALIDRLTRLDNEHSAVDDDETAQ